MKYTEIISLLSKSNAQIAFFGRMYHLMSAIARQLRTSREELGLSQTDLATMTSMKQANIARLERGSHFPTLMTLFRISEALDMDLVIQLTGRVTTTDRYIDTLELPTSMNYTPLDLSNSAKTITA